MRLPLLDMSIQLKTSSSTSSTVAATSSRLSDVSSRASSTKKDDVNNVTKCKSPDVDEMLTWPGSCESSSPVNSPTSTSTESLPAQSNISDSVAPESQADPSVLDPAFIEKLGEEINFLNQHSTEIAEVGTSVQTNPSSETLLGESGTSSSSKSSVDIGKYFFFVHFFFMRLISQLFPLF